MKVNIDTSDMLYAEAWRDFKGTDWKEEINVRDFIQHNYTPYEGDESFLADATPATTALWEKVMAGIRIENATHAPVDFDTNIATTITAHDAGYIEKELEKIVGLQTDKPLKRALHPFGGVNMIKSSFHAYGREMDADFEYTFTDLRKTHNQGVFDVYSPDMLRCRKSGVLTGLPDGYGRGRIIGDYRRVALYGIRYLVRERELQFADLQSNLEQGQNLEATIRLREELAEHRRALLQMQEMAAKYGYDISRPARNAQEAVQWLYFAYLAAVKSQNGGAMSLGRTASFLDIYIERDFNAGLLTEQQAQELIDHFIMKIRMVRFLRTPEFDSLFSGDPIWATEVIGGMGLDGRTLVTKNSFRYLHTLHTMGPAPEPNLTILWSEALPVAFKKYAAQVSIVTSSLQYENDDLMRTDFNSDDYAIACCVSPMVIGKQMQFFGARANLAKTLLYAINGGVDEKLKIQVGPKTAPLMDEVLDYDAVMESLDHFMDWLAVQYISALNIIHYMHDKYSYEASIEVARHKALRAMNIAFGILFVTVFFYAVSFTLAMGHDEAVKAYEQNISALAIAAQFISGDGAGWVKVVSVILNIFAVMTAFFGVYLGFREATQGIVMNILRRKMPAEKIKENLVQRGIMIFAILLAWSAIVLNAPVLSFTSICSPIFGMVGCLIPAWLVYKVPALHKYKGASLYLIIITGLLLCVSPFLAFS